jgi:hypothetical protein
LGKWTCNSSGSTANARRPSESSQVLPPQFPASNCDRGSARLGGNDNTFLDYGALRHARQSRSPAPSGLTHFPPFCRISFATNPNNRYIFARRNASKNGPPEELADLAGWERFPAGKFVHEPMDGAILCDLSRRILDRSPTGSLARRGSLAAERGPSIPDGTLPPSAS